MPTARDPLYRRHRFPAEVISYAVWLYFRFPLSLRMVEEMLAARGMAGATYETVRRWGKKFGKAFSVGLVPAAQLAQPADGEDLVLVGLRVKVVGHQRHLAVVVDEADARQPLVRDARLRFIEWK